MKWTLADKALHSEFAKEVERRSGQNISHCYQCGKCSGGCPVLGDLKISPNRVIRLVQLGLEQEALSNETVWCCAGCGTCTGRCPMNVDIVRIMDSVREIAEERGTELPEYARRVWTFYRSFLDSVKEYGRLSEVALMGSYNINSGRLFTNVNKAPFFLLKGKIGLTPHKIKKIERLQRVFQKIEELESK